MDGSLPLLVIKLIGTPAIVGGATLAGRRWGPTVAGWIGGLPLASGPLTYFLAVEQSPRFAAATLAGMLGVAVFGVAFCRLAPLGPWILPTLAGVALYLAIAAALLFVRLPAASAFVIAIAALIIAAVTVGSPASARAVVSPPPWDLPARTIAATALVIGLSALAATLGARVVGLIAPFPVYASIMGSFTHALYGPGTAIRLIRGVVIGLYGFACFYLSVALLAETSVLLAFAVGTVTALIAHGGSMVLIRRLRW